MFLFVRKKFCINEQIDSVCQLNDSYSPTNTLFSLFMFGIFFSNFVLD